MPNKTPDVWDVLWSQFCEYVVVNQILLGGMFVTFILSLARKMSDGQKDTFWGVTFEVLSSVFFVGAAFDVLDHFAIDQDFYRMLAVGVGSYGTILVRKFSNELLRKFGIDPNNPN